jgi:hypothetical protein
MNLENIVALDEFGRKFEELTESNQEWVLNYIATCLI